MDLQKSSIKVFVSNLLGTIIGFLGVAFLARELGPSQIGIFFLFQAILNALAIPADFGIRGALEKRISEGEGLDDVLTSALLLKLIPISVVILLVLLFREPVNTYLGVEIAMYLCIALVLEELFRLLVATLRGEMRVGETAILYFGRRVIWAVVASGLVILGYGVMALVYALLIALGIGIVAGWYKTSAGLGRASIRRFRSLFNYSRYNFISSIGGYAYNWVDIAIIGFFLPHSAVGLYEVAWRITEAVLLLSRAIATTVFPQISSWDAATEYERISSLLYAAITPSVFFVIPAFFGSLLFAQEILGLIFGPEYTAAWLILIVLMGEKILQAVHTLIGRSLQAVDRPDLAARAAIVAVPLNLVLNIVLVPTIGAVGAALATAVSFAVSLVLHGNYLSKIVDVNIPVVEIAWCFLSAILMTGLVWLVQLAVPTTKRIFPLLILMGAGIYIGISLASPKIRGQALRINIFR